MAGEINKKFRYFFDVLLSLLQASERHWLPECIRKQAGESTFSGSQKILASPWVPTRKFLHRWFSELFSQSGCTLSYFYICIPSAFFCLAICLSLLHRASYTPKQLNYPFPYRLLILDCDGWMKMHRLFHSMVQ